MSEPATNVEAQAAVQVANLTAGPEQADRSLIQAVLNVEFLKNQAHVLAFTLQGSPRDHEAVRRDMASLQTALTAAWDSYSAFSAIRSCQGSA